MIFQRILPLASFVADAAASINTRNSTRTCKVLPDSPDWPSLDSWNSFNTSIDGRLHSVAPPGAVCHSDQPSYNLAACNAVQTQWTNTSFHAANPWSVDTNDNACEPNITTICSPQQYPAYAVVATRTSDVQHAVKFAHDTGVRLVIKGTGHDYLGRSTGPGTLEIWTHLLRGVNFMANDSRSIAQGGAGSVKVAAGMRWGEIYKQAAARNLTVVGGADPNVGVGGWALSGGHGPVTSLYGLGVDQILELEVVTADGAYRVVNETCNSDLFWALRGSGSSFAVLLSMTIKSYPSLPGTFYEATFNTTANSDSFWSLAAHFSSKMPALSDAGGMGYYYINPYNSPDPATGSTISASFLFPNKDQGQVSDIMEPFAASLTNQSWAKDTIRTNNTSVAFQNFMQFWSSTNPPGAAGYNVRIGSWLLGDALTGDVVALKASIQNATSPVTGSIGHVVAGKGVRNAKIPGGSNSVLPAWRNAYVHFVATHRWTSFNTTQKTSVTDTVRNDVFPVLRELEPQSGSYMNEADPTNPQWQHDYFGANYPRLLEIKNKWDPESVFYCRPCVGHELWEILDGPANLPQIEWGVGQVGGKFCKKS